MKNRYAWMIMLVALALVKETNAQQAVKKKTAPTFETTDVFVGGKEGYHTFRIPVLLALNNDTLLAFCEGRRKNDRDVGEIDLLLRRSFDGGRTWEPIQILYQADGDSAIHNPVAIADPDNGAVHLIFVRQAREVFYMRSMERGANFSASVSITPVVREMYDSIGFDWDMVHTGPGHGLRMRNGRLVVPLKTMVGTKKAVNEYKGVGRRAGVIFSDDNGKTWQAGGVVPLDLGDLSEGTVIERRNGSLLFNIRWHEGSFRVVTTSADGGLSWSKPRADVILSDQGCQGSMLKYTTDSKDPRVFFSNLPGPFFGYSKREGLTVRLSYDEGRSWAENWEVAPDHYTGYSDLAVDSEGRVLILFEGGTEIYSDKIMLTRLDKVD